MFEMEKELYVTAGIANSLPKELQTIIWGCLEVLKEQRQQQMDYFQIFNFTVKNGMTQIIANSQEEPMMERKFEFKLNEVEPITDKIWVVDSGNYITMLFPDEY